jgi:hypothetical protein
LNHLEQLISEWLEYQGYFIRRNVRVGKRAQGGYECELDIVGFDPKTKRLVQYEPSTDADSWDERERRYRKKFKAGKTYIPALFSEFDIDGTKIEHKAVFLFGAFLANLR